MRFQRIENPAFPDEAQIAKFLNTAKVVVLQYSKPTAYNENSLGKVNALCERFGSRLNIRFYGHYNANFDCRTLRHLPYVRSLNIDCLMEATHLETLDELTLLEEFVFGVFKADVPRLLESRALRHLRRLVLADTHKKNIDLGPLQHCSLLEELFINGHTRHIEGIATLPKLQRLSLGGIGKAKSLAFIGSIAALKSLTYILGGRLHVNDLAHPNLERLEILRVLGLSDIDLAVFPKLKRLTIEDQLRLTELDISFLPKLERLSVFNCRNLERVVGVGSAHSLESLRIGMTNVDLDQILNLLPPKVRALSLHSPRKKLNDELQKRIAILGLPSADYTGAP